MSLLVQLPGQHAVDSDEPLPEVVCSLPVCPLTGELEDCVGKTEEHKVR